MLRASRVAALVPKLKSLEATQDLAAHQALVRHLQFSPNGKFLATSRYDFNQYRLTVQSNHTESSWDRTSVIFRVGVSSTGAVNLPLYAELVVRIHSRLIEF